jgi:uncharacterized flavoprotein (TIGR03862 family)
LPNKTIAIIGGGAAALMLAAMLNKKKYTATIYEKNKTLGRKFLVAGDGGFNLTHSQPIEAFVQQYTPQYFLQKALSSFTNNDLRNWLSTIGITTFVGSSKRVYPTKGIKPIAVLQAILSVLKNNNTTIKTGYDWVGFTKEKHLQFANNEIVIADIVVFALGGGSWQVTGTNNKWLAYFNKIGITTKPLQASNCAFEINWDASFAQQYEGVPVKNISLSCNAKACKGEIVITKTGIEGGAIYALSGVIRNTMQINKKAIIYMDAKPTLTFENIFAKLQNKGKKTITAALQKELHMQPVSIALLKNAMTKEDFSDINKVAKTIKSIPLTIIDFGIIDAAISTVGGIPLDGVDENFQLKQLPNHYAICEMLDWDAPTGGYLLQACFSMGCFVAKHLNEN